MTDYHREYRATNSDFQVWLSQEIWSGADTRAIRRDVIADFTEELTAWLRKLGYSMNTNWGFRAVSNWLYSLAVVEQASLNSRRRIKYPHPMHRDMEEDYDYFSFVLNWDTVQQFMQSWQFVEDFDPDTRMGKRIWFELTSAIYPYLDLDNSKNGQYIRDMFDSSDSDSDGAEGGFRRVVKKHDANDVYLQEMQSGFHGGEWSKV
jgi:hypothetical protein